MINVTLRQLRYFEAVARHRHFRRAAEACAISQPALSMQIKELEEELGAVLFERNARKVRLTGFGETVAQRVRQILRSVDELGDLARAGGETLLGRLRIGLIPTVAPYLLPDIMQCISESYPELDIHVRESVTSNLIQDLTDGRLDAAIVALPVSEPSLTEVALFSEEFVLVRSSEYEGMPVPRIGLLQEMQPLLLEEGHCFRDQALAFCNIQPHSLRDTVDASSLTTLVQMVAAGKGITFLPEMAVPVETGLADVSVTGFPDNPPSRTIGMVWRRSSPLSLQLLNISEVVRGDR